MNTSLTLTVLPDTYAICRLDAKAPMPEWAQGEFVSSTRTHDELSLVCPQRNVPATVKCERDWRVLKAQGQFDFGLTGILASLAAPLAKAEISIFSISTFDTDYVLVKQAKLQQAIEVLRRAKHWVETEI